MKIIIDSAGDKIEVSSKIQNIDDALQLIKRALLGLGFTSDTIKKGFKKIGEDDGE